MLSTSVRLSDNLGKGFSGKLTTIGRHIGLYHRYDISVVQVLVLEVVQAPGVVTGTKRSYRERHYGLNGSMPLTPRALKKWSPTNPFCDQCFAPFPPASFPPHNLPYLGYFVSAPTLLPIMCNMFQAQFPNGPALPFMLLNISSVVKPIRVTPIL